MTTIIISDIPKPHIEGVSIKEVMPVNFNPHVFVIGNKTMRACSDTGIIGPSAPCSAPDCNLTASEHTHENALALEVDTKIRKERDLNQIPGLNDYLLLIKPIIESKGLVGWCFVKKRIPPVWINYHLPTNYHLGDEGCACYLEPPNHPRYFVRTIYAGNGNSPSRPPYYYLWGKGYEELEDVDTLFEPLPLDHPRVQEWIKAVFGHLKHCYFDERAEDNMLIYPVPYYKLQRFHDDVRFSEEWRAKEKLAIEQANKEIQEYAQKIATPDNHQATRTIRKYYPQFVPDQELIDNPPSMVGNWWAKLEVRPTPENCPGEYKMKKHPVNGSWCQFCGWRKEE
jgi:hypothetical protein